MRLSEPRVPPIEPADWGDDERRGLGAEGAELQANLGGGEVFNVLKTMVHHPDLCAAWMGFSKHLLFDQTLPPREREMAILRIGWLCQSGYEFGQHILISQKAGLTREEIRAVAEGPDAPGWNDHERTLLRAVDELHGDAFVSDAVYRKLSAVYDTRQIMDLVFTVGQYNMLSMALNTLGVQLDPGVPEYQGYVAS